MKTIDVIMALADAYAKAYAECTYTEREDLVAALEAALKPPVLEDIEQYRLQMAGINTAALGYWKQGDGIHPDYDTLALRDVAKLYAKYDKLYKAALKPGEECHTEAPYIGADCDPYRPASEKVICPACCTTFRAIPSDVQAMLATPPAQKQKGLFVDLIAQHPGLAEELKAIDDAPMPGQPHLLT